MQIGKISLLTGDKTSAIAATADPFDRPGHARQCHYLVANLKIFNASLFA